MIPPIPSSFAAHHLNFFSQISPYVRKECFVPQSIRRTLYRLIILDFLCSDRDQGVYSYNCSASNSFSCWNFLHKNNGQILRCPIKLILYLSYFSLIDSLLNMDYQKCLWMYTLPLGCSGVLASRKRADILTMHRAARSYSGTDKLKYLDIFLLLGQSSTAKLPDCDWNLIQP